MGPDVPLLNDYKQEFFWKRFPQTVLGGPRFKLGYCAPPYVYIHQIMLFLTPWLIGGVGTLLHQLQVLEELSAASLSGGLMLGAAVVVQALAVRAAQRTGRVERIHAASILAEEEEVEFASCAGPETVRFLIPGKRLIPNTVLHAVLAGVVCGLGTWYLLLSRLSSLYGSQWAAGLIFILSWVTLCIGEYSLIINTAPETATFQPQDTYEITPLTRPLYILIFIAVDIAQSRVTGPIPALVLSSQVLHVLFLLLPLLWALGMLSPLDALLLWGMEQTLVFGLGGSPMSTNFRLLVMFMVSVCVPVCTFFIPSTLGVVLFTVVLGFLLSLDFSQVGALLWACRMDGQSADLSARLPSSLGWGLGWREVLLHLVLLLGALTEAGLLHYFLPSPQDWSVGPQAVAGYLSLILFVINWTLQEVQGVYLLGGVFHNPLYPKETMNVKVFKAQSKCLRMAGMIRRVLVNLVAPFAMIAFLAMDGSLQALHTASLSVGFTRAFRAVWQSTEHLLFQVTVVAVVRLLAMGSELPWWNDLGTGVQLILVSLASDRLLQLASKMRFALTVLVTSWTEKKQRRQWVGALLALNAAFSPLLLCTLILSALLSAPLLPLFTLPVFLVGFPRPQRCWPGSVGTACSCPDSVYYQQMSGSLAAALRTAFAGGVLGLSSPGSHFLGRFQDRIVWINVLERGFGYCSVNIKGLELQETSCHTAEARRVDEVFESAFEAPDGLGLPTGLNLHWGNAMTPCAALPICTYSDARSVLTGIIDSHTNLHQLRDDFLKVLVWVLLQYCVRGGKAFAAGPGYKPESRLQDSGPQSPPDAPSPECRQDSPSLNSLSDWSDEDDLFGPQPARKTTALVSVEAPLPAGPSLPGSVELNSLYGDVPLSAIQPLQPLGLGLPAMDRGQESEVPGLVGFTPPGVKFGSPHADQLEPPLAWRTAPLAASRPQQLRLAFPEEWFHFVLGRLGPAIQRETPKAVAEAMRELHAQVALNCLVALGAETTTPSPSYVYRVYCGDVPWTEGLDWLTSNTELYHLTIKAFRYSFKLLLDQASLGAIGGPEELLSTLEEYEQDWYIGLASEHGWRDAVLQEKPFLFSLGYDITMGTYTGRVLTLQEVLVQLGHLNGEGVRGQWANLSWELLYATNDDEERYSIQAHPMLLRNLTVQAADPPLGYPIYSSAPLHLPIF
ncbi:pecanex-like protein 4 isoform X1 [Brienomyrus brachyistius]|uniref:pecanex-like protein 4 isoform X1 n=1 Tax=Brienomyrus brachyistius TaxID=42636 RepID=UPI0020B1A45F|nr:pecanex-like protein 4 isoform X1 [Brienomyrus brachyistius]